MAELQLPSAPVTLTTCSILYYIIGLIVTDVLMCNFDLLLQLVRVELFGIELHRLVDYLISRHSDD